MNIDEQKRQGISADARRVSKLAAEPIWRLSRNEKSIVYLSSSEV